MSRIDKYSPRTGGFRAPAGVAFTSTSGPGAVTDLDRVLVVGLNASGRVIKATTALAAVGIVVAHKPFAIGDMMDVMTAGEVVELAAADLQSGAPAAGTQYILDATASRLAAIGTPAAGTNVFRVGWTVEAGRLVVRCGTVQG